MFNDGGMTIPHIPCFHHGTCKAGYTYPIMSSNIPNFSWENPMRSHHIPITSAYIWRSPKSWGRGYFYPIISPSLIG